MVSLGPDPDDEPPFTSLNSSLIAPMLESTDVVSSGRKILVAWPSAMPWRASRYWIAMRSGVGSPVWMAPKTVSIAWPSPSATVSFWYRKMKY